jgi:hypothetical protein
MQTDIHMKPAKAPQRPLPSTTKRRSSAAEWQPEPGGLTREELRKIVIDLIG